MEEGKEIYSILCVLNVLNGFLEKRNKSYPALSTEISGASNN